MKNLYSLAGFGGKGKLWVRKERSCGAKQTNALLGAVREEGTFVVAARGITTLNLWTVLYPLWLAVTKCPIALAAMFCETK
tara:strand:- start:6043 stop:6285 length:243 start_codon:yes stop_codon:yes gene_type:complete